ncbi:hypothetical protein B9Z55_024999 [Caenorhabditis nigoni]|uniref:Uncharacterized protein n=1 Tax=Caenorhabditis nigoni TaxID=1611254 RepID=A0A2G5SX74_9PELO|nr:hypothetical protein B9Z55_024999 [Caenorhabditis nigoni]
MPNLEVLVICDLQFESKENLQEIFSLKKLRVLDMGTSRVPLDPYSENLNHYLSCGQTHEELRFIDVYGNDIGNSDLESLVDTHPMLVQIGLIDTPLQKVPLTKFTKFVGNPPQKIQRNIEFFTVENMQCCLSALRNYLRPEMGREKHPLICIFEEIELQLTSLALDPTGEDVSDCFDEMLDILICEQNQQYRNKNTYDSTALSVRVLNILLGQNYLPLLSTETLQFISTAFLEFMEDWNAKNERMDIYEHKLQLAEWTFFNLIIDLSDVLDPHLERLCILALKHIVEVYDFLDIEVNSSLYEQQLNFLLHALRKMTPEMKPSCSIQSQMLEYFVIVIGEHVVEGFPLNLIDELTDIVYELMRLGRHRLNWNHSLYKKSIRVIVKCVFQLGDEPFSNILLGKLEKFLKYINSTVCGVFFEKRTHRLLT